MKQNNYAFACLSFFFHTQKYAAERGKVFVCACTHTKKDGTKRKSEEITSKQTDLFVPHVLQCVGYDDMLKLMIC